MLGSAKVFVVSISICKTLDNFCGCFRKEVICAKNLGLGMRKTKRVFLSPSGGLQ